MRGKVTVTAQMIYQLLSGAIRRTAVPERHNGAILVTAIFIRNDGTTHIERLLLTGGVKMRIKAFGIPVPDLDLSALQGLPICTIRSEEHTSEIQSRGQLVSRLLRE